MTGTAACRCGHTAHWHSHAGTGECEQCAAHAEPPCPAFRPAVELSAEAWLEDRQLRATVEAWRRFACIRPSRVLEILAMGQREATAALRKEIEEP